MCIRDRQEEDKSTDEVEPQKDKSGKKGSKKTAKKNGKETDDKWRDGPLMVQGGYDHEGVDWKHSKTFGR